MKLWCLSVVLIQYLFPRLLGRRFFYLSLQLFYSSTEMQTNRDTINYNVLLQVLSLAFDRKLSADRNASVESDRL